MSRFGGRIGSSGASVSGGGGGGPAPGTTEADVIFDQGAVDAEGSTLTMLLDGIQHGANDAQNDVLALSALYPHGAVDADDELVDVSGAVTFGFGVDAEGSDWTAFLRSLDFGAADQSLTVNADLEVTSPATLATATGDWQNPTNAQGLDDGAVARLDAQQGVGVSTASGVLTITDFGINNYTGFTRGDIFLDLEIRIDTTVLLTSSAEVIVDLYDHTGTFVRNLITSTRATTSPVGDNNVLNEASPVLRTFDITSDVGATSNANLSNWEVRVDGDFTVIVAGGGATCDVDYCYIRTNFTATGLT